MPQLDKFTFQRIDFVIIYILYIYRTTFYIIYRISFFYDSSIWGVLPSEGPSSLPDLNMVPELSYEELLADSEANAAECDRFLLAICHRAEEIARNSGVTDAERLSNIVDAVKYLADVDELDEEARIPALHAFKEGLDKNETWVKIDQECKRWGGRGLG